MQNIDLAKTLPVTSNAAIFFMNEEGHYIFVYREKDEVKTKTILAEDIQAAFSKEAALTQWIPPSVRATGYSKKGKWFIAVFNPGKVTVSWRKYDDDITYVVPPTLLLSVGGSHYFFAITDPDDVTRHTQLYYAPYLNCNQSGNVCWGTNDHIASLPENAEKIWQTFINSVATHSDNDKVSTKHPNLGVLIEDLRHRRKYPMRTLVRYNILGNILDSWTK